MAIRISGAQGVNAGYINGLFELMNEGENRLMWRGFNLDCFLQCQTAMLNDVQISDWWVSDDPRETGPGVGWAYSAPVGPGSLPMAHSHGEWHVRIEQGTHYRGSSKWDKQKLQVRSSLRHED